MDPRKTYVYQQARKRYLAEYTQCVYCGKPATTIDHVLPVSKHPELAMDLSNWVAACERCNKSKGNRARIRKSWRM